MKRIGKTIKFKILTMHKIISNNNIVFIIALWLSLFSLTIDLWAQQEFEILSLHNEKTRPVEGQLDDYSQALSSNSSTLLWYVFSDKDNNQTYQEPGNTGGIKKSLSFLEMCYVVDEKEQYVRLAKGVRKKKTLTDATDYGWIHKENLILYPNCVVSKNEITIKGLILNVADDVPGKISGANNKKVKTYKDPDLNSLSSNEIRFYSVFYVYKDVKNAVLIGKSSMIHEKGGKEVVLGWVPKNKVFFWNNRVALEPNWRVDASRERESKKVQLNIFDQKRGAQLYKQGEQVNMDHILMNWNDPGMKRREGYDFRFPILQEYRENGDEGLLKIAAIGEVTTSSGDVVNSSIRNNVRRKYEKARQEQKNINIVFAIEGTKGMDKYLQPIADALTNSERLREESLNSYRYGIAVYGTSSSDIEVRNLTDNLNRVSDFITEISTNQEVGDEGVAMYAGLDAAINRTNINKKHTNIIFLIGEHGDQTGDYNETEIIDEAFENNCHIIGLQTHYKDEDIYLDFQDQLQDLITKSAKKRYNFYKDEYSGVKEKGPVSPPEFDEARAKEYSKFKLRNTSSIGILAFPFEDENFDTDRLKKEIELNIVSADNQVNELINRMDLLINGVGSNTERSDFNYSLIQFMIEKMEGEEEEIRSVDFDQYQGAKVGYTSRKLQGMEFPLYQNVLFLDVNELSTMLHNFSELIKSVNTNATNQRKALADAWKSLLMKYEGGEESALNNMTIDQMNTKVFGLPGNSPLLQGLTLGGIENLDDTLFQDYIISIRNKKADLEGIFNDGNYRFSFVSHGIRYFWISEDMLP